ncbi:MAG: GNAT family N-acetyltransferase [Trueperaceae bacterium]|nr:GNAT family N-acetyltransferase [Trueperaceae bacterium]
MDEPKNEKFSWHKTCEKLDWEELSHLYKIAPLADKKAADLKITFANSRFVWLIYDEQKLLGAGRALADGLDCSYICDVAVHPDYQGYGIGKGIMSRLLEQSKDHRKIILYAAPGKEGFYKKLGFKRMTTAMAIFQDEVRALGAGLVDES